MDTLETVLLVSSITGNIMELAVILILVKWFKWEKKNGD